MKKSSLKHQGVVRVSPHHVQQLINNKAGGGSIAPGFTPQPKLDLKFMGGRTIANLSFKSFYLGAAGWAASDIQNLDTALSGAMADVNLNNVMQQYFPGGKKISTTFLGSTKVPGTVKKTFTRDDVNPALQALVSNGSLNGVDFDTTVICLFLPPKIVLSDKSKSQGGQLKLKGDEDEDSSKEGLGGYHGSAHIGNQRIYFAVGVYSQFINGKPNGIPIWPDSWKNIVATFYHELNEARTDPDVEEAIRTNKNNLIGWYANVDNGGEVGDVPINVASDIKLVMVEVPLVKGGTAPIQLMWSNQVHGPQGPFA